MKFRSLVLLAVAATACASHGQFAEWCRSATTERVVGLTLSDARWELTSADFKVTCEPAKDGYSCTNVSLGGLAGTPTDFWLYTEPTVSDVTLVMWDGAGKEVLSVTRSPQSEREEDCGDDQLVASVTFDVSAFMPPNASGGAGGAQ